jgi:hypothetical protein
MNIAKLLLAPTIFFTALCLFLLAPESRAQALMKVGLHLNSRIESGCSLKTEVDQKGRNPLFPAAPLACSF